MDYVRRPFLSDHRGLWRPVTGLPELNPTPNIDRLAREGMRFDRCYVGNSICVPSRATLLTGKHSHLHGKIDNDGAFDHDQQQFQKVLQQYGYLTAMIGKIHLSGKMQGFDHWEVLPGQGDYYQPYFRNKDGHYLEQGYVTDIITDKSLKRLESGRDQEKPFMLMIHHKAAHRSWMPAPRHVGMYDDIAIPEPESLFDDYATRGVAAHGAAMKIRDEMSMESDLKLFTTNSWATYEAAKKRMIKKGDPFPPFGGWEEGVLTDSSEVIEGKNAGAFVRFETAEAKPVLMKVGISYTSVEGARRNLQAELSHWDFDQIVLESQHDWNFHLSRIQVEGGSNAQKTKFYTDLWRSLLGRRILSDADGAYSDMTGEERVVRHVPSGTDGKPAFNMHNFDAWWGSHWSLDILWPLLCPERYRDFCKTSVQMYENGGLIPRGPSGGNYTFVMIGDSAAPFITSAYAKGILDFDCEAALCIAPQGSGARRPARTQPGSDS